MKAAPVAGEVAESKIVRDDKHNIRFISASSVCSAESECTNQSQNLKWSSCLDSSRLARKGLDVNFRSDGTPYWANRTSDQRGPIYLRST